MKTLLHVLPDQGFRARYWQEDEGKAWRQTRKDNLPGREAQEKESPRGSGAKADSNG